MIVLLSGGVGGAKLAEGLAAVLPASHLAIVGNTGDDLEWYGVRVCPDLDIVMYTLAGIVNRETGWGIADDTFHALEMLGRYAQETWFRLGDRDLATAVLRTLRLSQGLSLTEVTERLCRELGVRTRLIPMSDDPVRTMVRTPAGELDFQNYFVARGAQDQVVGVRYAGVEKAVPSPLALTFLEAAEAIIIAPSNPFLSIGPILALPGMRAAIQRRHGVTLAVSPLVAGQALKGPAASMMQSLGYRPDAVGVAGLYHDLLDVFVIDAVDAPLASEIERLGMAVAVRQTVMTDLESKRMLAAEILQIVRGVRK
ncbi:MAG: 2-phospho-L-lactate transferase [bacterium]|nr:2-phospho-L-lactate transferase [bacterium]